MKGKSTEINHIHTYDENGKITCCSLELNIDKKGTKPHLVKDEHDHSGHDHGDHDDHNHEDLGKWPALISFTLLITGLLLDHFVDNKFFNGWIRIVWYLVAYLPVAYAVLREAFEALVKGSIFNEFFLMSIATIGAFVIGEYPEGVAVMLFYAVGELFQMSAVKKAKHNISALLDVRAKIANVFRNDMYIEVPPEDVVIGEKIQVRVGERIPLDGILLSNKANLNTAAISGESKPQSILAGEKVMAGSINLESLIEVKVNKIFSDSSISRILELVQNATAKKAKTELLIRRLAKIYTPFVVYFALAVCFLPYFFIDDYQFTTWFYRALIFLVISCPCALVISIPLGYFGGLGAASKNGILFKGATYLDEITKVNTLVMDKTGTVTEGVFSIKNIVNNSQLSEDDFMQVVIALESKSTHPISKAICNYGKSNKDVTQFEEIAGKGLKGIIDNETILVGNQKLLSHLDIETPGHFQDSIETVVYVSINNQFSGYITLADAIKKDAYDFVKSLKSFGISEVVMLSGDTDSITQSVAKTLGIHKAKGNLLPEQKLKEVNKIKKDPNKIVAFVGDGINDAPVLAVSDLGIAMGALGSDVAIETADIIIQTDQPSKILTGIKIGKATQKIIWQNIYLAFGVKAIVLILGAIGMATMWEAVFADVGVALLAILNAIRIQRKAY